MVWRDRETRPANDSRGLPAYRWLDQTGRIPPFNEVEGSRWDTIVSSLLADIDRVIGDADATLEVLQIKQKLGTLRFYYRLRGASPSHEERIRQLVLSAYDASSKTCFECGQRGELRRISGYLATLCKEHVVGLQPKP